MSFLKFLFYKQNSVKSRLTRLISNIPKHQKAERQYLNAVELLEHYEFGLSSESILELTYESEYNFSAEFWKELSEIFNMLKMEDQQQYCKNQTK